jgi:hypothetical protein
VGYLIYFVFPSQLSFICWFIMTLIFLSFWTSRFHSPIAPLCIPACNYDRGSNQKISESPGLLIAVQPFTSLDSSGRSYGMPTNTWSLPRSGSFSESLTLPSSVLDALGFSWVLSRWKSSILFSLSNAEAGTPVAEVSRPKQPYKCLCEVRLPYTKFFLLFRLSNTVPY